MVFNTLAGISEAIIRVYLSIFSFYKNERERENFSSGYG